MDLKKYTTYLQQPWSVPVFLLVICFATFGLLASKLGFYFDDWTAILALHSEIDLWEFYQSDRPFSAWTFLVFEPIFGLSPLNWQIFTILLRWLTAWGLYWILRQTWPDRKQEVFWITLVFAVHPVFMQQPISVAYSQHFITYALFVLSVGAMLAMVSGKRPVIMFVISILASAGHLLTMEYFWGLELIRPALLWIVVSHNHEQTNTEKIKGVAKNWLPYIAVLVIVSIWRFLLVDFGDEGDTNSLRLLTFILSDPINGTRRFIQTVLRDVIVLISSSWYKTLQPSLIDLDSPSMIISWGVVGLIALVSYIFGFVNHQDDQNPSTSHRWATKALGFGLFAIFVGMLPGWMVAREISVGLFSDRIALPAMIGASIVSVCLVLLITPKRQIQLVVICVLVGLAAGTHFRIANEYRWEWVEQRQFFWQLYWRAPELEENTAILADGALFNFTGEHPTGSAVNVLYSDRKETGQQPYWFFEIDDNFFGNMNQLLDGEPIEYRIRNYKFDGNGHDNLVAWFDYPGSCVWVLTEQATMHPGISEIAKAAIPVSNLSRIIYDQPGATPPPQEVFGQEPPHTWCYYFQKANIAYYQEDWEQIVALGHEVEANDFEPNTDNKLEWYPFIEAYGRTGDWERAETLSILAFKGDERVQDMFCKIWSDLEAETNPSEERDEIIDNVISFLECQNISSNE